MADGQYPVSVKIDVPGRSNRLLNIPWIGVMIRGIMIIPIYIILGVLGFVLYVLMGLQIHAWAILFSGRYPEGLARFYGMFITWATRLMTYMFGMSDTYPGFFPKADLTIAPPPAEPMGMPGYGAPQGYPGMPGYPPQPQAAPPGYPQQPPAPPGYPQQPPVPPGYPQQPQAAPPGYPQQPPAPPGYPQQAPPPGGGWPPQQGGGWQPR
jgi:hypothetical protein